MRWNADTDPLVLLHARLHWCKADILHRNFTQRDYEIAETGLIHTTRTSEWTVWVNNSFCIILFTYCLRSICMDSRCILTGILKPIASWSTALILYITWPRRTTMVWLLIGWMLRLLIADWIDALTADCWLPSPTFWLFLVAFLL